MREKIAMGTVVKRTSFDDYSDEELMVQVAAQRQEALQPLHSRYAPLVFHLAAQTFGPTAAEDIVQEVFMSVWRKANTFNPERGSFRPWLLQIAHFRILNELRRRSRRPQLDAGLDDEFMEELPDPDAEPIQVAWNAYRREAIQAAVNRLPPPQRQALSLAFFEDLTHDQVAAALDVPLGTVKTRIRTALQTLRVNLAPLGIITVLLALLGLVGVRYQMQLETLQRDGRALVMVTDSAVTAIHLPAAAGVPQQIHGSYRGKPGTPIAVIALDNFPAAPAGKTYQGWVLHNGKWISLGAINPDANGSGVLIAESPDLAVLPEAIQVTLEPAGGSSVPTGQVMIASPGK
jgi:RNA polymerase sigma-70 factor (ECF subfamily)